MLVVVVACITCSFAHKNEKMRRDAVVLLCVTATALVVGIEKGVEKSRPQGAASATMPLRSSRVQRVDET